MAGDPCSACGKPLRGDDRCRCARCMHCGELLTVCRVPVDESWPARAREAYAMAGYELAATCPEGQARDMARIGWCWDRARRDPYWTGERMTDAERRGVGFKLEEQERRMRV